MSSTAAGTKITWKRADGSDVPGIAFGEEGRPGVVVIQEWWGVDEDILRNAERVAEQGYRALVPDLYRGKVRLLCAGRRVVESLAAVLYHMERQRSPQHPPRKSLFDRRSGLTPRRPPTSTRTWTSRAP